MTARNGEILLLDDQANLRNYDETAASMDWKQVEEQFSWSRTGQVNIVYEAIDRHIDEGRGKKAALL